MPLLWEQSFCWKSPIALGYTRGHFSALVAMENDGYGTRGAGANLNTDDDVTITFLPLVDSERKLLHVHFLSAQEVRGALLSAAKGAAWCQHQLECLSGMMLSALPVTFSNLVIVVISCKYWSDRQTWKCTFSELLCRMCCVGIQQYSEDEKPCPQVVVRAEERK